MMFSNFYEYYAHLSQQLQEESWASAESAAVLLSLKDKHADCSFLQVPDPETAYSNRNAMDWAFDDLILMHLQVLNQVRRLDWQSAYANQAAMLQLFNKEVLQKEKELNWFMPVLYVLCSDLRLLARAADLKSPARIRQRRTEATSFYEEAAAPITESYRICVSEGRQSPNTKKVAILNITNQLFRVYFRTNRLQLMKPLIRSIDHVGDLYESFSLADRITYNYYLGRKAMFDMDLPLAEKSLSFAFQHCPNSYSRNKRSILIFLIPVKVFLGHMPTIELLQHYNLSQFIVVVNSVKNGNLRELEMALQQHQNFFIKCGIFLMLEKLKIITYRNLFKKVTKILNTHLIKLDAFLVAMRYLGSDLDADEVACVLSNLIAEKKIKGYISHQKQTLVISKQDSFPPLSSFS